jgi:RNA 2',3'-cyclic 3'-phosphodiesterase
LQRHLRTTDAQASWVKPANIHLTLKFLGDVEQTKIPLVIEAVKRTSGSCSQFQVTVSGAGCFPSLRHPNILWVGIEPLPAALQSLRDRLENELAGAGFQRETKKFSPHLTIARIRNARNSRLLADELIKQSFAPETFTATEIIVMRSEMTPQGSIYTPQAVLPLAP